MAELVEARIVVDGTNAELVSLWDWLFDDADLRDLLGRDASIEVDSAGEYVVSAEIRAIWPVLARTVAIWLTRYGATITVVGPDGRTALVSAAHTPNPEAVIRSVLGWEPAPGKV